VGGKKGGERKSLEVCLKGREPAKNSKEIPILGHEREIEDEHTRRGKGKRKGCSREKKWSRKIDTTRSLEGRKKRITKKGRGDSSATRQDTEWAAKVSSLVLGERKKGVRITRTTSQRRGKRGFRTKGKGGANEIQKKKKRQR